MLELKNQLTTKLTLAACALALSGCASLGGSAGSQQRVDSSKPNALAKSAKKDIYIGNIAVEFLTTEKSSATANSGMFSSGSGFAKQIVTARLDGVPESTMQQLANFALQDLRQQLTAKGYNVLSYSQYQALPKFSSTKPTASPLRPNMKAAALMKLINTPTLSYTFAPSGMMLSKDKYNTSFGSLVKSSGVPVVTANYTLGFAHFGSSTDATMNYNTGNREYSAEVTTGQALTVNPESGIHLFVDQGGTFGSNGQVKLRDPVVVKAAYGTMAEATSNLDKAANIFSGAMGVLSGGSMNVKRFAVNAAPARCWLPCWSMWITYWPVQSLSPIGAASIFIRCTPTSLCWYMQGCFF